MQENLKLKGAMTARLIRADGSVESRYKDNIILNVGFDFIADAIGNSAARPAAMGYLAVGTGSGTPVPANSALDVELTRSVATYAHTAGTKVFSFTTNFAAGVATGAITEAGILNAATDGILLDRVVFLPINKAPDDTLQMTFTFTMS